jgi:hypothetical protein
MKFETWVGRLLAGEALLAFASVSPAQNVVKLGMVGEFSGPLQVSRSEGSGETVGRW